MQRASLSAGRDSVISDNGSHGKSGNRMGPCGTTTTDRRALVVMFVSLVIDLLAFTMILPLLPSLLDYYGHNDDEASLYYTLKRGVDTFRSLVGAPDTPRWNSVLFGGMLGSLFSFLQYLTSPVIGAMSDVYGRKPLLIATSIGIAASYGVWAISRNFSLFVLARVIGGISKGNISLSTAVVSDTTKSEDRAKGMAVIGVAFSVGFLLGPLIGAYFSVRARDQAAAAAAAGVGSEVFYTVPALFALMLSIVNILVIAVFMKETLPTERRVKSFRSRFHGIIPLVNPLMLIRFSAVDGVGEFELSHVRRVGVVYFLFLFLYSGLEFTLTFLTHNRFEFDSVQQGKMFFVVGIVMILVQGGFVRRAKPGKEMSIAFMGLVVLVPAFIIIAFAHRQLVLYIGLVLYAFASAVVVPCLTANVSSYGGSDQKGVITGILRSLGALARSLGPIVASTAYWSVGPECCYVIGALGLLVPLFLLHRIKSLNVDKDH